MRRWLVILLAAFATSLGAQTGSSIGGPGARQYDDSGDDETQFRELDSVLPEFPRKENLREFYVSAVASNKFFIDASTIDVGADGVVRYVLVVNTAGGATNVSYEGIHCDEHRWKIYATGSSNGTWKRSRAIRNDWRPIENKPVNRHHSVLRHELFCPMGRPIKNADDGRNALRLGKHPDAN